MLLPTHLTHRPELMRLLLISKAKKMLSGKKYNSRRSFCSAYFKVSNRCETKKKKKKKKKLHSFKCSNAVHAWVKRFQNMFGKKREYIEGL